MIHKYIRSLVSGWSLRTETKDKVINRKNLKKSSHFLSFVMEAIEVTDYPNSFYSETMILCTRTRFEYSSN